LRGIFGAEPAPGLPSVVAAEDERIEAPRLLGRRRPTEHDDVPAADEREPLEVEVIPADCGTPGPPAVRRHLELPHAYLVGLVIGDPDTKRPVGESDARDSGCGPAGWGGPVLVLRPDLPRDTKVADVLRATATSRHGEQHDDRRKGSRAHRPECA
jgi:hypothetical protein